MRKLLPLIMMAVFVVGQVGLDAQRGKKASTAPAWRVLGVGTFPAATFPSGEVVSVRLAEGDVSGNNSTNSLTRLWSGAQVGQSLYITARVVYTGDPIINFRFEQSNTCERDPTMRPYMEQRGYFRGKDDKKEHKRWWSRAGTVELFEDGTVTFMVPLTAESWSSLHGKFGDFNAESRDGFRRTVEGKWGRIGFTGGGGCFFGHGVNTEPGSGTVTIHVLNFEVR